MNREQSIRRTTLLGSLGNLVLVVFKLLAGVLGHSAAMVADAVHSLSDLLTDIVVLVFVRLSSKPKDDDHGFGHGKYETLATAVIGLALVMVGVGLAYDGLSALAGHLRGNPVGRPGGIALLAALVSIAVKELLYRYTARQGKRLDSPAVVANAWHHRSDALSSVGTALGVGGALLLGPAWYVLDPLAALVVSAMIIHVGAKMLHACAQELLEQALPAQEQQFILRQVEKEHGVSDPHNLRTRRIGNYCAIDIHLRMDPQTTVGEAHAATRRIEIRLREHFGADTIINTHVEPTKDA